MLGIGTIINVVAIVIGASIGSLLGARLPERTSRTVTDGLGILTLVLGGLNLASLGDKDFVGAVTAAGTFLVVTFAVVCGSIVGSLLNLEARLESFGGWLQGVFARGGQAGAGELEAAGAGASAGAGAGSGAGAGATQAYRRERFITAFVNTSLIMAVGPMAILGAMSDGMGDGANTLIIKSILDGFGAIAFAASLGMGVAAAAITVGLWQGAITVAAMGLGNFIGGAEIAAITATGGVLMLGIGMRIIGIRQVSVANMLPALLLAPLLTLGAQAVLG